jgi:hypothetical protein
MIGKQFWKNNLDTHIGINSASHGAISIDDKLALLRKSISTRSQINSHLENSILKGLVNWNITFKTFRIGRRFPIGASVNFKLVQNQLGW